MITFTINFLNTVDGISNLLNTEIIFSPQVQSDPSLQYAKCKPAVFFASDISTFNYLYRLYNLRILFTQRP
jgi:hypothetical protein